MPNKRQGLAGTISSNHLSILSITQCVVILSNSRIKGIQLEKKVPHCGKGIKQNEARMTNL